MWSRARLSPRIERSDVSSEETASSTSPGDRDRDRDRTNMTERDREAPASNASSTSASSSGAQLLRFFGRSSRRTGVDSQSHVQLPTENEPSSHSGESDNDSDSDEETHYERMMAEKRRMERVYREVSGQTRRGSRAFARQGTSDDPDDLAWVEMDGNVTATMRFTRRKKKNKNKSKSSVEGAAGGAGAGAADGQSNEVTTEYLDAVLVKPDYEVFNKYTRFFLDPKLEQLYQEYTAVNWFSWARGHMLLWIAVHGLVALLFVVVPFSGFKRMDLFLMDDQSLAMWFQYAYLMLAIPFALLPSKINPFQKHWRSWVCLIVIVFNVAFHMWLASANRLALNVVIGDVDANYQCVGPNATQIANSTTPPPSSEELDALARKQKRMAISVMQLYAGALVQVLAVFASAFSFIFIVSTRVEFVQCVIVGVAAVITYTCVIAGYDMELEWMTAVAYFFALVLLLVLSHSSDLNNRRSFLSQLVVEKENESLQSYLTKAEAVLMNDAACEQEKEVVGNVLDNPEMKHLDMVRIPFADIKFLQAIGRGANGDVIKAKYFGTIVVCKRMRRENITDEAAITSFREEIELMSSLRHPNIVQFIGATWDNCSNVCIVMEYLENGDMHSVLHSNIGRNFTWADPLLKMAVDAAQGMLYLHSQENPVVHRDLKSVNIFCSATFGCKVGDFGLSRRFKKDVDALTTLVGTPFWLAPEIIRNERYGPSADVFSFGIVLTELETRRTPYHDQEETGLKVLMRIAQNKLRPSLPMACPPVRRQLILDCLHDEPDKRPTFADVLRRLQGPVQQEIEESAVCPNQLERRGGGGARPALVKRGSDQSMRDLTQLQQGQQTKRDMFFDIINNVHNPV